VTPIGVQPELAVPHEAPTGVICLIVEDEVLVGMDLENVLCEAGFDARWVASTQGALAALETTSPHVAILDIIIRAVPCTDLARELKRRGIPFLLHSGCFPDEALADFQGAPWLGKPAELSALLSTLAATLASNRSGMALQPG